MNAVAGKNIARDVHTALERHPNVREVRLIGSRARGDAGPLSDWDFEVITDDFQSLAGDIEQTTAGLEPIVGQWDRLSPHMCYMLIVPGPVKIDLLFLDQPHRDEPPWDASAETLAGIDAHFWDWTLWLASKDAADKRDLVAEELAKMFEHILAPMGVQGVPASVAEATSLYRHARERLEERFNTKLERDLENAVSGLLARHGYEL